MAKARIAVVGAGLMGHGIAQVFALAGHDVTIYDSTAASLDTVKMRILANLKDLGDDQKAVERVTPVSDLAQAVRDADYVVEAVLEDLPLNYDNTTLDTIELIDVLWLKRRSIVRAFEVEHTTAVYSGLLRMADLLALQPNMDIRLHIVAPDERREKVFREMSRPVFSLLDRGPLSDSCTYISYESVDTINDLEHLAHTNHASSLSTKRLLSSMSVCGLRVGFRCE